MIYYDIDYNDEHLILEHDTAEQAMQWMQERFALECEDSGLTFGESQAEVITMKLDNNDEPHEIDRTEFTLSYEGEPSQMSQHCTWGR